jgi:actin-related protein
MDVFLLIQTKYLAELQLIKKKKKEKKERTGLENKDRQRHTRSLPYAFFHNMSARSLISTRCKQKCFIPLLKIKITAITTKTRRNAQIN